MAEDFAPGPETQMELPGIPAEAPEAPIDRLRPGSPLHATVLKKLTDRIDMSERKMKDFYGRWRMQEKRMQAHVDLPQYEQLLKQLKSGSNADAPAPTVAITVPYTFATIWTIVTYLAHTFTGKKPIFQVGSNKAETVRRAENMEIVLQYNADHTKLIKELFQFFLDGELYGMGAIRTLWSEEYKYRTSWTQVPAGGNALTSSPQVGSQVREKKKVYEGNECKSIDPFMFFPDPRVPMVEVARRGEFAFWRSFEGEHSLKKAQGQGNLKWVDAASRVLPRGAGGDEYSARNILSGGDAHAGTRDTQDSRALPFFQVDQGTVEIIPSDWGLGESDEAEKWIFTILNRNQIVQAEPLMLDHDMHPVAVAEPYSFGYGFGQVGLSDMTAPLQDTVSWFINSHIYNVRSSLNNSFVYNPSALEVQDLKNGKPGKLIRLKPSAYGVDVRTVIQQLQVADVTQNHMNDIERFLRMGDQLSAVNDNLRGITQAGGRKTATEVRTSGEAGASRLAAHARLISSQAIVDLTEQMSLNIQQNMTEEFAYQVMGQKGLMEPLIIRPQDIVGDFYYPIHDGTLPIDKIATLDIWKEILMAVLQDPGLRAGYNVGKIFEFVAELGGARNITSFKLAPQEQIQNEIAMGAGVPVGGMEGLPPDIAALLQGLA